MNKKIIRGGLIVLFAIIITSVTIFAYTREKELEPEVEEVIAGYEETENTEEIKVEEQEEINEDTQEEIVESSVVETPKQENKPTTPTNANNKTNTNTPVSNTSKPVEPPKEEPKVETPSTPKVEQLPVVEKCTNNSNHATGVGNCGKWYSSKAEGIADYDNKQAYWGNLWTNYEIDTATYDKNCPSRYEIWSCKDCGKWTLDYFYR